MIRLTLLLVISIAASAYAGNLISSDTWVEDGGYKMARQDFVPYVNGAFCSTCTTSRIWDGTTIKLFGGKGELLTWVTYLHAGPTAASNVMVTLSSFTGTGVAAGTGFASVAVSSTNAWDYTQRPYSLYVYQYTQQVGMSQVDIYWDPTEYDEQQLPARWRLPCTVNASSQCPTNDTHGTATAVFTNRHDHDKFYPDQEVPIEEFTPPANSSFTVSASSSQAIGGEVYISTGLIAGATYTATLTVYEGSTISTSIPVALYVYNATLPPLASIPVLAYVSLNDFSSRLTNTEFPTSLFVDPYYTNTLRIGAFLHRHKVTMVGNEHSTGQDYPSVIWTKFFDGSAYTGAYGLAYNTGPGYAVAESTHVIGPYGGWHDVNWSTGTTGGSNDFCTNVSSYAAWCTANKIKCYLYTINDENAGAQDQTIAHLLNTNATCLSNGRLFYTQTGNLNTVSTNEPDINAVWSTQWLNSSTQTWQNTETAYLQSSTHSAAGYNSGLGVDSILNIQEDGLGPREVLWGAYKTGQPLWFLWSLEYWTDVNNTGQTQNGWNANSSNYNDLSRLAKDFGYDNYPTTSTFLGHTGFQWTAGDGNMLYPATDLVFANPNYGFNGVIGSWRLNMLTRGIQDVDIIELAAAKNPTLTATYVNSLVQDVMYLRPCFTNADCSYSYGNRPWDQAANDWETTREALLQIAATGSTTIPAIQFRGTHTVKGKVTVRT